MLNRYLSGCNHMQQLSLKFWKIETTFPLRTSSIILARKTTLQCSSHNPERIIYSPIKQMANWTPITSSPFLLCVFSAEHTAHWAISCYYSVIFSLMLLLTSTLIIWIRAIWLRSIYHTESELTWKICPLNRKI